MIINLKNKDTLEFDDFKFKCSIGKNGINKKKVEGDKTTPKGIFNLGKIYFRSDRIRKPTTILQTKVIKKEMGWCNDIKSKYYNREIKKNKLLRHETLFRKDYKYDIFIVIKYNYKKRIFGSGSAIFIHLTKNYSPTDGCIALNKKDLLILLKLINRKTKIKIY